MKKISILLLLLVALSAMVFVGCSDDEKKTVAAAASAQGWVLASVYMNSDVYFYADFMPMTNGTFVIDSVIAGDSLCENDYESYWYVYGDGNYDYVYWDGNSDEGYTSGDPYEVTFYMNGSSVSSTVNILNRADAEPQYILPIADDTLGLGTSLNILWNSIPEADWYGMRIQYYKDSAGTYVNHRYYVSTTDTSYTIPASTNIYNGYYNIYIVAATGPGAGDPVNINGAGLLGEFHSESNSNYRRIYFGTGDPTPVGDGDIIDNENVDLTKIGREIIKEVRTQPTVKENNSHQY